MKLPAFYGTLRFIAVFTTAHHLSLAKSQINRQNDYYEQRYTVLTQLTDVL